MKERRIIRVAELKNIQKIYKNPVHKAGVESLCVLDDNKIFSSGDDGRICCTSSITKKTAKSFDTTSIGENYGTKIFLFYSTTHKKTFIIVGFFSGSLAMFQTDLTLVHKFSDGHSGTVWEIEKLRGDIFFSVSNDLKVRFFNVVSKKCVGVYNFYTISSNYFLYTCRKIKKNNILIAGGSDYNINFMSVSDSNGRVGESDNNIIAKKEFVLKGHTMGVWSTEYVPELDRLISGSTDQTVRVWDLKERKLLHTWENFKSSVCSMQIFHSHYVCVGSNEGEFSFLDVKDLKIIKKIVLNKKKKFDIWSLSFLKNDDLVIGSKDGSLHFYNTSIAITCSPLQENLIKRTKNNNFVDVIVVV